MEKLAEGYKAVNDKVDIEVQQSDSTTGMTSAIDGLCDIGMASRDLKDSETRGWSYRNCNCKRWYRCNRKQRQWC